MNCQVNKPYPPIQVEKENISYAEILLEDYAGEGGEDTAIHLYVFQSIVNRKVSKVLEEIAKVEMHHLKILGELIYQLGYPPSYYTVDSCLGTINPWSSRVIHYEENLEEFLQIDIKQEQKTIQRYQKHIEEIQDKYIQDILKRIIEDEKMHVRCFQELYQQAIITKKDNG